MDELNIYFEKASELKSEKQLIDDAKLNSIIKKKKITNNLLKGAGAMSILTIITIGLMFLFSEEKPEQKLDPETMRKLPIFHLTIEELEEMNLFDFPKTAQEIMSRSRNSNELLVYKQKNNYIPLVFILYLRYKIENSLGSVSYGIDNKKSKKLNWKKKKYFYDDFQKLETGMFNFKFIDNDYFEFKINDMQSFVNIVPISLKSDYEYITDFVIFAVPNEDLYQVLPERYKKLFKENFITTNEILIDEKIIDQQIEKLNVKFKSKVKTKINYLELELNELEKIGLNFKSEEISFVVKDYSSKTDELLFFDYIIDNQGKIIEKNKTKKTKLNIYPEAFYIFKNKLEGKKFEQEGVTSVHIQNKYSTLNYNTFDDVANSNEGGIDVIYNQNREDSVSSVINKIIPIKFSIESGDRRNDFVFWYQITDDLIDNLPERYKKRFRKEVELYSLVLANEKEIKELCAELEEESLLGLCINESINNINLYPNPANSNIKIDLDLENDKNVVLKIFDISGKELISINKSLNKGQNKIDLDVNKISRGIYIINIFEHEELLFSRNVIIE